MHKDNYTEELLNIETAWQNELHTFIKIFNQQTSQIPLESIFSEEKSQSNSSLLDSAYTHLLRNPTLYFRNPFKNSNITITAQLMRYLDSFKKAINIFFK